MSSLDKLGANDFLSGPAQKSSVGTVQSDFSKQLIWDSEDESLQSGVTCSSSQIPPLTLQCSTEYNSWKAELSSSCTHIYIYTLRRRCVSEGRVFKEMHFTDRKDSLQGYTSGQVPGFIGVHVFKLNATSSQHLN